MKKIIISLFLNLVMCSVLFAESYYFNRCKLSDILSANYSIDLSEKMINIKLEAADGSVQKFSDPIGLIEKDKITSKKIKSRKSEDAFFVYYLDSKSKSVIQQNYKKEVGIGLIPGAGGNLRLILNMMENAEKTGRLNVFPIVISFKMA